MLNLLLRPWIGSCHETGERLSDYLEDELDPRAHMRVARHLTRCKRCRALLESLARTVEQLRSLGTVTSLAPSPATVEAVRARIERRQ